MWWQLLLLLAVGAVIASLAWSAIKSWFSDHTLDTSAYGEIIKNKLNNGDYRVVAGVFNRNGNRTAKKTWHAKELEDDLQYKFGSNNKIIIEL